MAAPVQFPNPTSTAPPPLNPEQMQELQRTRAAYQPLKRGARVARSSAITTAVIAGGTAVWAMLVFDWGGLIAAVLLGAIATVEFVGYGRLLRADPAAVKLLTRNQLAFLAMIALYCLLKIATFSTASLKAEALPADVRAELAPMPEIAQMVDQNVDRYGPLAYRGFYALVLLVSVGCQGGMAWYYARREKHVAAFQAAPAWAKQLLWTLRD